MSAATIEQRMEGSRGSRFFQEFFGNSAQFPIANFLLELLLEGPRAYLAAPDGYAITIGAVTQALLLSGRPHAAGWRFWGNLAGPAIYTAIEVAIEGPRFFDAANHWAYWGYGLAIAALQALACRTIRWKGTIQVAEDVVKASILLAMYVIFENVTNPGHTGQFFVDRSHRFVAAATLLLGLSIGLAHVTGARYLRLLRETASQLKLYSEWLLGRELLEKSMHDPGSLVLRPQRRAVLFMDIRGFTRWSEARAPEAIVAMLNGYYAAAEAIVAPGAVKFKFAADELMAVFPSAGVALAAARELRAKVSAFLGPEQLGAGMGVHAGPVIEGLLGTQGVKFYDAIGDTVNTAKRIEGAAGAGEVLISADAASDVPAALRLGAGRRVTVKGKEHEIEVFPLLD